MTNENQSIEATVKADGATVKATGDVASRVGDTLVGLISPLSESAAAIGDMVRVYRQQNAIRSLHRTRELAAELNIPLTPVAPKFLVQWIEGASLEDPGPDDLSELWSNLLISASQKLKPTHLLFKRLLTEMSGRHVELLKWLCDYDVERKCFDFNSIDKNSVGWNDLVQKKKPISIASTEFEEVFEKIKGINSSGIGIFSMNFGVSGQPIWYVKESIWTRSHSGASAFVDDHSFVYLRMVGLIEEVSMTIKFVIGTSAPHAVEVKAWHITPLGIDFLKACDLKGDRSTKDV